VRTVVRAGSDDYSDAISASLCPRYSLNDSPYAPAQSVRAKAAFYAGWKGSVWEVGDLVGSVPPHPATPRSFVEIPPTTDD
jgi:hypothetical protein